MLFRSAYIGELTQHQELTSEIRRLREVVSGMNSTLQLLSRAVGEVAPNVVTYPAGEFLTDMGGSVHSFGIHGRLQGITVLHKRPLFRRQ